MAQQLTRNQEIAGEILRQLGGGSRLRAMIGAGNFVAIEGGVRFSFKGSQKFNWFAVTLNDTDLYDLTFTKIRGTQIYPAKSFENVHVENLREIFQSTTGLYLSL